MVSAGAEPDPESMNGMVPEAIGLPSVPDWTNTKEDAPSVCVSVPLLPTASDREVGPVPVEMSTGLPVVPVWLRIASAARLIVPAEIVMPLPVRMIWLPKAVPSNSTRLSELPIVRLPSVAVALRIDALKPAEGVISTVAPVKSSSYKLPEGLMPMPLTVSGRPATGSRLRSPTELNEMVSASIFPVPDTSPAPPSVVTPKNVPVVEL